MLLFIQTIELNKIHKTITQNPPITIIGNKITDEINKINLTSNLFNLICSQQPFFTKFQQL